MTRGFRRGLHLVAVLGAGVMVSSCAETNFAIHAAKQIGPPPGSTRDTLGVYKVGSPYWVGGVAYRPRVDYAYAESGIASWYGPDFHGKRTANGARFDQNALTAAHQTLPLPSKLQVTNLENGRTLAVTVNDRGPFVRGRIIDLSRRSAQLLGFDAKGTAQVRLRLLPEESMELARQAGATEAMLAVAAATESGPATAPPTPPATVASRPLAPPVAAVSNPPADESQVTVLPVRATGIFVQAGAFAEHDNAQRLRARLAPLGSAQVTRTQVAGRELFRVRLGPVASVREADGLLDRVVESGYPSARLIVE